MSQWKTWLEQPLAGETPLAKRVREHLLGKSTAGKPPSETEMKALLAELLSEIQKGK